jgi:hypothetical protein
MISALLMFRTFLRGLARAVREDDFVQAGSTALGLVLAGTFVYWFAAGWSFVDSFYFAVATLTTSSIADSDLELSSPWLKLFTSFYVLTGIGILIEIARRLGLALIAVRETRMRSERHGEQPEHRANN